MGWFKAISDTKEKASSLLSNKAKTEQDLNYNNKAKTSQQRLSLIDEEVSRLVKNDSKPLVKKNNKAPDTSLKSNDQKAIDTPKDMLTPMRIDDDFFEPFPLNKVSSTVEKNKDSKDQSNISPHDSGSFTPVASNQTLSNVESKDPQKQKASSFTWKITPQLIEDMSRNFQKLDATNSGYLTERATSHASF
eukprot:TRINITY_DN1148_c0_g1_i5.p1 TRINITY_DN1148_c0_g1~~TRINITY_DN1148_c0_g1_i5.p1  ORF type:complete len:191 (-),score=42.64 TRINITY_DN1148_c0_g1_i5:187-759(-)